jgi:hypothetical protein
MMYGEPNFDFVRYLLRLPDGRWIEASMFIAERTVRLQAALVDGSSGVILKTSPRRVFAYDPATIDGDREFFTAEFEQIIGFELPEKLFDARCVVQQP